jgi:REP element-mobilizing transposase RayT
VEVGRKMNGENGIGERLVITRRYLPHWQVGGSTYFISFRLDDPVARACPLSAAERRIVKEALLHWHDQKWHVYMLTVMPDHVHVLATPGTKAKGCWYSLSEILRGVKGYTARAINVRRRRSGRFWQHESYDRIVRDEREFDEKALYILGNAVKVGLTTDAFSYDGLWCESMGT